MMINVIKLMAKMAKVSQSSFLMIIFCLVTVAGMCAMLDTCFKGHAFAHSGALHPALDWLLASEAVRQCTQREYAEYSMSIA